MASFIFYKDIINLENFETILVWTKSNVSPGIDGEVKKDINEKRLNKLYNELKSQKYRPRKSKRVARPKLDGGGDVSYLGIASQIDKVVQVAILNKFESLFENIFLDESLVSD